MGGALDCGHIPHNQQETGLNLWFKIQRNEAGVSYTKSFRLWQAYANSGTGMDLSKAQRDG